MVYTPYIQYRIGQRLLARTRDRTASPHFRQAWTGVSVWVLRALDLGLVSDFVLRSLDFQQKGSVMKTRKGQDQGMWPEECREANWKPVYAFLFADECRLCAYSCPLPKSRRLRDKFLGVTRLLHCTNHPANPGGIEEVLPTPTCRNFKAKPWRRPKAEPADRSGGGTRFFTFFPFLP
jgi:hypothetical protein